MLNIFKNSLTGYNIPSGYSTPRQKYAWVSFTRKEVFPAENTASQFFKDSLGVEYIKVMAKVF